MAVPDFPVERVHAIAATSCATWVAVALAAHLCTPTLWRGYSALPMRQQLAWTNRISSALHALLLVAAQARNLGDVRLRADPLFAVNGAHFFWGSVMYGYLVYDTAFTLAFWRALGAWSFLAHHTLGLACCAYGLYHNRMALFGMAIQVFFESTTPLLHLLGCLKIAGRTGSRVYLAAGLALIAQFAVCRVAVGSYYWALMIAAVWRLPAPRPGWALGGVAVFGALLALNTLWLLKLIGLATARMRGSGSSGGSESGGSKAGKLAMGAADAAHCKAMAGAVQPGGSTESSAGADLTGFIKSSAGRAGGGVISLSARAGSLSAVEAAAHAAAYAAAKAQSKRLRHQNAMPRQADGGHGNSSLSNTQTQNADWLSKGELEADEPVPAADADEADCRKDQSSDSKQQAMPSLMRQGMSGPLDGTLRSGSGNLERTGSGGSSSRSRSGRRHESHCDCVFCGDSYHGSIPGGSHVQ